MGHEIPLPVTFPRRAFLTGLGGVGITGIVLAACGEAPPLPPLKATPKATAVPKPTPDSTAATPTVSIATKIAEQRQLGADRMPIPVVRKTKVNPEATRHLEGEMVGPVSIVDVFPASDVLFALSSDSRVFKASAGINGRGPHPFEMIAHLNPSSQRHDLDYDAIEYPHAISSTPNAKVVLIAGHRNIINKQQEFTTAPYLIELREEGIVRKKIDHGVPDNHHIRFVEPIPGQPGLFMVRFQMTSMYNNSRTVVESGIYDSSSQSFTILNTRTGFFSAGQLIDMGLSVFAEYGTSSEGGYGRFEYDLNGKKQMYTKWYRGKDPAWNSLLTIHSQLDRDGKEDLIYAGTADGKILREEAVGSPKSFEVLNFETLARELAQKDLSGKSFRSMIIHGITSTPQHIFVSASFVGADFKKAYPFMMSFPGEKSFSLIKAGDARFVPFSIQGVKSTQNLQYDKPVRAQRYTELAGQAGILTAVKEEGVVFIPCDETGNLSDRIHRLNKGIFPPFDEKEYGGLRNAKKM